MLTLEELKRLLYYNELTGEFISLISNTRISVGDVKGYKDPLGYIAVKIRGKIYKGHRLAWFYVHGEWPNSNIDHINRNRADNRLSNLRLATHAENSQNISVYKTNTSGYMGVSFNRRLNKWTAQISANGRVIYLGTFSRIEDAIVARQKGKQKYHTFNPGDAVLAA